MEKVLYKELSFGIIGAVFDVYNTLGSGYQEKYYERALAVEFRKRSIIFKEQYPVPLEYEGESIGRYAVDFLINNKIVLELKKGDYFSPSNIKQVIAYLKALKLQLGILVNFTSRGVKFKRILNL
jgi:GxxExxY protein